ncbi:MAG: MarR family transcriptional regulator [Beijerinckiaceae bacterium]|nr:MarR family transcriptional regulator [Beijerinckiaceae bacterium]
MERDERGGTQPTARALARVTGVRLRRLQALFARHWSLHFRGADIDLSSVQGGLLLLIRENPDQPQAAFARLLAVEPPSLAQTLAPLVSAGLVERRRARNDGRAMALRLTPAGAQAARLIEAGQPQHEARLLAGLTKDERQTLLALLEKAVASAESAVAAASDSGLEGKVYEHA